MSNHPHPVLVEVVRGGFVEGTHRGTVLAVDPSRGDEKAPVLGLGEPGVAFFPRSAVKPLQALGMLRAGFQPAGQPELALAAASHSGETMHTEGVAKLLAAYELTEDDLGCPPALPQREVDRNAVLAAGGAAGRRMYMNCSGKHAAMLASCVQRGWPTSNYLDPEHPLQQQIRQTVTEVSGNGVSATAVDGCGAPVLAITPMGLARALHVLVSAEPDTPERRVADAMRAHPEMMSGTDQPDARLMRAIPGLLCKSGAEGVHAGAMPDGRRYAIKIDDGAERARMPVLLATLRALRVELSHDLDDLRTGVLLGGGAPAGEVRPTNMFR